MKEKAGAYIMLLIILSAVTFELSGQDAINIKRIDKPINFDGIPDEDTWQQLSDFKLTMWRPNFGSEPSENTIVKIGYDNEFLWVSAILNMNDASKIFVATKKRDEMMWDFDSFGIILDTYNDNENALAFFTNPAGLRTDFTIFDDGKFNDFNNPPFNTSWDTFWDVKTITDEKGWSLEMRIPFSSLKFKTENGIATMGIIINRTISSNNETDLYPAIDPKYSFSALMKPSQAVKIKIEGARPTKPIYISPYVLAGFSAENALNEDLNLYERKDKPEFNAGLDIKYNLNSNLTLDLTANTDFAQVEADDQQVNLTRYSLFFPEKRKFFQERSSLFDFKLGGLFDNLFYSRNIGLVDETPVKIFGGARLTGRVGKTDLGILDLQTAKYDTTPSQNFGVIRMRRQVINQNSYVGGIFTSRINSNGNGNYTYGIDGIFKLFGDDFLNIKWAQSFDSITGKDFTFLDPAFILIDWERRSQKGLGYNLNYTYSGTDFNPGIGFILRQGVHGYNGKILYGWLPGDKSKFINYNITLSGNLYTRISDKEIESVNINPYFEFITKNGIFSQVGFLYQKEGVTEDFDLSDSVKVFTGNYNFTSFEFFLGTAQTRKIAIMSDGNVGQFYDGYRAGINLGPIFNLSASFNLTVMYGFNAIRFPDRQVNNSLNIHFVNVKAMYMLNTTLSASVMVQYINTEDNLISNFRLRYNPREGNDFYLVYNDFRGLHNLNSVPEIPGFFNKTIMVKYVHTFAL